MIHDSANVALNGTADSTFVEPTTKEKLQYLRYFRLVTHRKRNGTYSTEIDSEEEGNIT